MNAPRLAGLASLAAAALIAVFGAASAQLLPPQNVPGAPPPPGVQGPRPMYGQQGAPACVQLEAQLAQLDNAAGGGGVNQEQVRRYDEAIQRQRFELDQTIVQSRRLGCDTGGGFFGFGQTRPPQCDLLGNQINRMRSNLDRMISELGNLRGGGTDMNRDLQRRQLVNQLAQNNCGPQYRQASAQPPRPRGLLEALFGGGMREESTIDAGPMEMPSSGSTYRTLCVRTCDGYFFPISFATVPNRFGEDEQTCHRLCPAAETMLFAHRNPGEEVEQAVATNGTPYSQLPNAFKYRQSFSPQCSCRAAGQSWAEALGVDRDDTLQRGDILVTEQRSKQMSQPRQLQQKGQPQLPQSQQSSAPIQQQPNTTNAEKTEPAVTPAPTNKRIRTVGPPFYWTR